LPNHNNPIQNTLLSPTIQSLPEEDQNLDQKTNFNEDSEEFKNFGARTSGQEPPIICIDN
jgi:hypothetical protein